MISSEEPSPTTILSYVMSTYPSNYAYLLKEACVLHLGKVTFPVEEMLFSTTQPQRVKIYSYLRGEPEARATSSIDERLSNVEEKLKLMELGLELLSEEVNSKQNG